MTIVTNTAILCLIIMLVVMMIMIGLVMSCMLLTIPMNTVVCMAVLGILLPTTISMMMSCDEKTYFHEVNRASTIYRFLKGLR